MRHGQTQRIIKVARELYPEDPRKSQSVRNIWYRRRRQLKGVGKSERMKGSLAIMQKMRQTSKVEMKKCGWCESRMIRRKKKIRGGDMASQAALSCSSIHAKITFWAHTTLLGKADFWRSCRSTLDGRCVRFHKCLQPS